MSRVILVLELLPKMFMTNHLTGLCNISKKNEGPSWFFVCREASEFPTSWCYIALAFGECDHIANKRGGINMIFFV